MFNFRVFCAVVGVLTMSVAAHAQPVVTLPAPPAIPFVPSPVGGWTVTVGIGGEAAPSYPGADSLRFSPVPIISVRRAGTPRQFKGMRDNISFAVLDNGAGFRAGPAGKYRRSRKASDYSELAGLRDVDYAIEVGGFAEFYAIDWLRLRAEVRRGFNGHEGIVADFAADAIVPLSERLTFAFGPRYTVTDGKYAATYFGVTPVEALLSGLPAFNAGSSSAVGAGAQLRYQLDPQWEVRGWIEYDRLLGSAADSPIVTMRGNANQITGGIGVAYSFDIAIR